MLIYLCDSQHPRSQEDWAHLLRQQRSLHQDEVSKWREILHTTIQLLDQVPLWKWGRGEGGGRSTTLQYNLFTMLQYNFWIRYHCGSGGKGGGGYHATVGTGSLVQHSETRLQRVQILPLFSIPKSLL